MSASPLSVRRFRNIFIISWLIIAVDLGLLLKWFGLSWTVAMIDSSISTILLLLFSALVMNTLRYYRPRRERYLNILAWCIFLTFIWLLLCRWILGLSLNHITNYDSFLKDSLPIRASIGLLLMGCVSLITVVWFNWEEQQENEQRKSDTEKLTREAELYKLRQQLQPHFLFNSLNSINALIGSRPEEARKMVQQLSDFLRGTIKKEEIQWVNLAEELQYLQLYLDIEKVRFGNRLSAVVESDESSGKMKIPALLLQPIVENAIKFGLYDTMGDAIISVKTSIEDNTLIIKVSNPYDPETASSSKGTGFGLKSVQRRLYLLFGRTDLLSTEVKENIFMTTIRVPQAGV